MTNSEVLNRARMDFDNVVDIAESITLSEEETMEILECDKLPILKFESSEAHISSVFYEDNMEAFHNFEIDDCETLTQTILVLNDGECILYLLDDEEGTSLSRSIVS